MGIISQAPEFIFLSERVEYGCDKTASTREVFVVVEWTLRSDLSVVDALGYEMLQFCNVIP